MQKTHSIVAGLFAVAGAGFAHAAPAIYFTNTSADTINRVNLDGSNPTELVSGFGPNLVGITATPDRLFWTDNSDDAVYSSNIDGSSPGLFLDLTTLDGTIFPTDITTDGTNVYFGDGGFEERLYRSPIAAPSINQIGLNIDPEDIEADANAGALYWVDFNEVFRSNLDGSNVQTIVGGRSGIDTVTVDPGTGTVYFIEDSLLVSVNGDGSGLQELLDIGAVPGYGTSFIRDVAFFDGSMYWAEVGDNDGIWTLDLGDIDAGPTQILAQTNIGNLTIIPSPGSAALLGIAGLAAARRRR